MNPPPPPQASQPRLQPNDVVENPTGDMPDIYRVVRLVGVGGMGAVYEAIRKSSQSRVALKEILFNPDELEASYFQKLQSAFLKEARILINLNREGFPEGGAAVPQAYDIFRSNGIWYLVMEYMEGKTLSELIGMGEHIHALQVEDVIKWGIQLAFTLEFLHQQTPPLIHADIKPSNIKIDSKGRASLLDFGIAKGGYGYPSVPFTRGTIRFATPYYAAPEQYRAQALSPATDVFALAATLYHAVTGERPPRVDERLYAMALDQRGDPLRPAHEVNTLVPRYLSQILALGMSLEVLQRPTNAAQFRTMLEQRKADGVVDMSGVSEMWGKPMGRYDAAGDANPKEPVRPSSDRVPSDRVREPVVPPERGREQRVVSDRVPSDRVRSDPVRDPVPSPLIPVGWSENPRPTPVATPAPPQPRSSGSSSSGGSRSGGGIFSNSGTIAAVILAGVAVLMLLLIFFLPTEDVSPTGDNGGVSGSPTAESAVATVAASPTEVSATATPEEIFVPVEEPTPEATEPPVPTESSEPTPGVAPTSTRLQTGSAPDTVANATPSAEPTQAQTITTVRPTRTATVSAPTPVPVVRLLSPNADSSFRLDAVVGFAWAWDGQLQGAQYYDLRIWREGEPHRGVASFTGTSGDFRPASLGPGIYFWSVAVVDNNGATTIANEATPARRIIID